MQTEGSDKTCLHAAGSHFVPLDPTYDSFTEPAAQFPNVPFAVLQTLLPPKSMQCDLSSPSKMKGNEQSSSSNVRLWGAQSTMCSDLVRHCPFGRSLDAPTQEFTCLPWNEKEAQELSIICATRTLHALYNYDSTSLAILTSTLSWDPFDYGNLGKLFSQKNWKPCLRF